jgi:hypothetical protein
MVIKGKIGTITAVFRKVIAAGYGHLSAELAIKLYQERN